MKPFVIKPVLRIKGTVALPGDKSIAHRAVILSSISKGITKIKNFPTNKDCLTTIKAFRELGIKITRPESDSGKGYTTLRVYGKGLSGLKRPKGPIFFGDSGTTFRLILGVLAGQDFPVRLVAGKSLSRRPMFRVTTPLRMMGAKIYAQRIAKAKNLTSHTKSEEYPPLTIKGGNLKPITYQLPVASAQVKSALLLAGLYAQGITSVRELVPTRDHTERMLKLFKADIKVNQNNIVITGGKELVSPGLVTIPGDISSAAFFIVSAIIIPNSEVLLKKVTLNPTRLGMAQVLKRMGADIKIKYQISKSKNEEPMGDLQVKTSNLKGTVVNREEIPLLIDELPVLMVAACFAKGKTFFQGVGELRVKETDRIHSMSENLKKMGAKISLRKVGTLENIVIQGTGCLKGANLRCFGDHRTAMSLVVAALAASGRTQIDDISCVNKSFPGFLDVLKRLMR